MTAIETYKGEPDRAIALRNYQTEAVHRLAEWAESAQAASHVAAELVRTSFVPESFRGKPHEATAAILAGMECGLSPMAALRSFDVIQGQAAPRALTLRAIVQSFGHDMVLEESTASRCKMRGRRNGAGEWQSVVWTIDRARSLGLTNKANWKSQPQAMLVARATSELARLVAADAILGIGYTYEEIADGGGAGVEFATMVTDEPPAANGDAPSGSKRMRRKPADTPPETTEPQPEDDGATDGEPEVLSQQQMKKLRVLYSKCGITDNEQQKRVTAVLLDVDEIDTHSSLTPGQASVIIDTLGRVESGAASFDIGDDGEVTGVSEGDSLFGGDAA